jgi:hypothetical protein
MVFSQCGNGLGQNENGPDSKEPVRADKKSMIRRLPQMSNPLDHPLNHDPKKRHQMQ